MRARKYKSRKQRSKQRGGRIPDNWEISTFLQEGAREAGMFEGENDDNDYDYNYPTSDWFDANFNEVVANMMTAFSASRSDIIEGLRIWYNNGEEGMGYYFDWIEDKLNPAANGVAANAAVDNNAEENEVANNNVSVHTGDPSNGELTSNNDNPRGGRRRKSRARRTTKMTKKTRRMRR